MGKTSCPKARLAALALELRKQAGLTQSQLAGLTDSTPAAVSNREIGHKGFSTESLGCFLSAVEAPTDARICAWTLLLELQGHSTREADEMARTKVALRAVA